MVAYLLNMEYLLAESYSCWATGTGIPDALRGGGPPSIGCQKLNFQDPFVAVRRRCFRSPCWHPDGAGFICVHVLATRKAVPFRHLP